MANDYYNHSTWPATSSSGVSATARAEMDAVAAGFALLPGLTGNGGKFVQINSLGTLQQASSVLTETGGVVTITGALTVTGALTAVASSATKLATARLIGGTSFDGTANIAVALASTATALATPRLIGGTSFDGTANITPGLASTATALATPRLIGGTAFDGTANIAVALATVASSCSGNAATATTAGSCSGNSATATSATSATTATTAGTVTTAAQPAITSLSSGVTDGTNELGYKGSPAASVTTGAFVAADRGKCVNATGGVTVPNATMAAGDIVMIDNQSGGAITITATITTLTMAGTALTGNRTLAANGLVTIKFRSSTSAIISGAGLS